jgi:hypothetical protein
VTGIDIEVPIKGIIVVVGIIIVVVRPPLFLCGTATPTAIATTKTTTTCPKAQKKML